METTRGLIHYYCREGYYRNMQIESQNGLKKHGDDQIFHFYHGLSLVLEGQIQDGVRELDLVKDDQELVLGATLALIHAHRKFKTTDKDAVAQLDARFKEERRKANDKALYYAGLFLFFTKRYDKAREYVDRAIKIATSSKESYTLKGWLEMLSSRESENKVKNVLEYFDAAIASSKDADALMGKAKFFEHRFNYTGAIDLLNQVIVTNPNFLPGLIEKMKMQLALQDWEQALDCANRCLHSNTHCIEAKKFKALHQLCVAGEIGVAIKQFKQLLDSVNLYEPKNSDLMCNIVQLFSRVCGRHPDILSITLKVAEEAVSLDDDNAELITELGNQYLMQNRFKDASKCFRTATKINESSISALTGMVFCQLLEGNLDVAEQQLEFLKEIHKTVGISSALYFLSGHMALVKHNNPADAEKYLGECIEAHFKAFKGLPLGQEYFITQNPDFLMLIVKDYLTFAPNQPISPGQTVPSSLKQASVVLESVTKSCPGLTEALFLLAKTKYLSGEVKAAGNMLQHIMDQLDATHISAHLLMAEIHLYEKCPQQASQSLERAVSYKFDIRDNPLYHIIKARVERFQNKLEEAAKTLTTAMELAGIKPSSAQAKGRQKKQELQIKDKVSLYLDMVELHQMMNQQHEAVKVMQDAINTFQGTSEEVRVSIANADLALGRGDIDEALTILRNISPDQVFYLLAREKMADIYLNHRKDKRLFASCYREVVNKTESLQSYLMLGQAYMSIQEPEKAIEVYEQALKKNPRNATLANRIGHALIKTHNYNKAITYYKEAIKNENQTFLRYDLAELYMRLKQYDKAEKVIMQEFESESLSANQMELSQLMLETKNYLLLSKIYQNCGNNIQGAVTALTKARDTQARILKRVQVEQPNVLSEQKQLAASICCQMADHEIARRDFEKSIRLYKEALLYNETDSKALLDLSKLYLSLGDLESCQSTCNTLLQHEPDNESATVMMADLMFRKNEYEAAMYHFKQLLNKKPDYFDALERLVEVLRRMGKLEDVPAFLEKAENVSSRASQEPGLHFCKGLYEWYVGNTNAALKLFNKARKSSELGKRAVTNMIEICLNPDNDTIGGEVLEEVDLENGLFDKHDFKDVAIRTADKLIREIKPHHGDINHIILSNFLLLATRHKSSAERALSEFMQLANMPIYRDHVGVILGMATAYMILKQTQRARNQLKRVAKNIWNFEESEHLERCWLLLADIYIQSSKYDMASELLKKVLEHNKSCCKAYEYMGLIMEKEQSYKDASLNYELAWKFSNMSNPVIGYKLAFNYMKAKRFVDAIDVCHSVLGKFPNYPKIRKEILEKSRSNLRI